jgi:hypothetical protein
MPSHSIEHPSPSASTCRDTSEQDIVIPQKEDQRPRDNLVAIRLKALSIQ